MSPNDPVGSIMFCPADDEEKLRKLPARRLPAVALDLEDAVQPERRAAGRILVGRYAAAIADVSRLWIRVNPVGSPHFDDDLDAVVLAPATGVILPKAKDAADVHALLAGLRGRGDRSMQVIALVESALGVLICGRLRPPSPACSPR